MRKSLLCFMFSLLIMLFYTSPALASSNITLYIDDNKIPTQPYVYDSANGQEKAGIYYMDTLPQLISGRVYVPIRIVSDFLGVNIEWKKPNLLLTYQDTSLQLTLKSNIAIKNNESISLDSSPYLKNNRLMVPIRVISEFFGSKVNYSHGQVNIQTNPLLINGTKIKSLQSRIRMTMGGIIDESKTNCCITKMYKILINSCKIEIAEPPHFGENFNLDPLDYYCMDHEYSFMNVNSNVIYQFKTYRRNYDDKTLQELGYTYENLGMYLIYDITKGKWYKLSTEDIDNITDLSSTGNWVEILNNVV